MRGRWRFRIVALNKPATYAAENGKPLEHVGTDTEALEIASRMACIGVQRVDVVPVGCPEDITTTTGRLMVVVQERADKKGWNLTGDMMTGTWHGRLEEAVDYGAFRTKGYLSETRIVDVRGTLKHVILTDQTDRNVTALYGSG